MLGSCDLIAFVPTVDLDRARAFFTDVLGLGLVEQTPIACVFQAKATMLRVVKVEVVPEAAYTIVGWTVPDIAASVRYLAGRGVTFERFEGMTQDQLGVWTAPGGDKVAWFKDPDGSILSVTQFAGRGQM